MKIAILPLAITTYLVDTPSISNPDFWSNQIEKNGIAVVMLAVALLFIFWRQKKLDKDQEEKDRRIREEQERANNERNALIDHNNSLTKELIDVVKAGNACKFEK